VLAEVILTAAKIPHSGFFCGTYCHSYCSSSLVKYQTASRTALSAPATAVQMKNSTTPAVKIIGQLRRTSLMWQNILHNA